jgi:peptide/nickel transport system permease protein
MIPFILKRCAVGLLLVFAVMSLIFLAVRLVPGDPAVLLAGAESGTSSEAIDRIRDELGLTQPLGTQYVHYLGAVLTGDIGESFKDGRPVLPTILERLPNTLELALVATLISVAIGIVVGAVAARMGGIVDSVIAAVTSVGIAIPVYVVGTLLILIFATTLRWLPAGGYRSWSTDPRGHLLTLVLPAIALSLAFTCIVVRMTRSSIRETRTQDWVRTATSTGMSPSRVFRRHVVRNSLTPVTTAIGLQIGALIGSTVLVERVFNYPGLSSLLIDAVSNRDYPTVQGVVIVISIIFIGINILIDILYGLLDPRVVRS